MPVPSEGGEYGGKSREYDEDTEEATEGTDESREEEEEYDSWDQRIAEEIADELREQEEAEETAQELAEELEEQEAREANESEKDQDIDDIFDDLEDARDQQHDDFVHDMHEKCPAKEAFSEEARRYYETEDSEEDTDSTETTDSYHDSGYGTMQVQKAESESQPETEGTRDSEEDTEESQSSQDGQLSEAAEPEMEQEDISEQTPAPEPAEEANETRSPKSFDGSPEETPMRRAGDSDLVTTESARGNQETKQATLDEFTEHDETVGESTEDTRDINEMQSEEETESKPELEEDAPTTRETDESSTNLEQSDHADSETTDDFAETQSDDEGKSEELETAGPESLEGTSDEIQDAEIETSIEDSCESQTETEESVTEAEEADAESDEEHEQDLAEILETLADHPSVKRDMWTGELYIDEGMHAPSMFPESREERLSRALGETWESLSEEEREKIRPLLFKDIDSEEDLGEALRQIPEVWDDSDFLAAQRDAIEYLNKSDDERGKTKQPSLLVNLQKHIAERRWLALLKLAKEFSELDDDEPLHEPSVTSEWQPEVVDKMLELNPDIKERADFDRWYREYRVWVEVIAAKDTGVIPDEPSPEQLKRLSAKFKVVVGTLRRWIREETAPYLISVLRKRMKSEPSVNTPMLLPGLPESYAEFLRGLRRHPDLMKSKDLLKRRERVKLYYGFFDFALENVGMPLQAIAKTYAQKHGLSTVTVSDWGAGKRIPILLRQVAERESGIATPRPSKVTDVHKIRSLSEYQKTILRHPYIRDLIDFNEKHSPVLAYFAALDLKIRYPDMSYREIARRVEQPAGTVTNWFHKGTQPPFLLQLANNERKRKEYEDSLSKSAKLNLIPSEQLYQFLKRFRKRENLTVTKVANSLLELAQDFKQPISFAKLRSYNHKSPRWLAELSKFILENKEDIERKMRLRSENSLRLGIVENTLYIRKVKDDPLDYFQMLGSELFFFYRAFRETIIRDAMKALGGVGQFNLSKLVRQMTDVGPVEEGPKSGMNNDLRFEADFLAGETLRFILEADGKSIVDVENQIAAIGKRNQISNPIILSKQESLVIAARLFAILASDGHIADDFDTSYFERNAYRRAIVRKWLAALGDVNTPDKTEEGVVIGFSLPPVLGRLMHRLGIPTGDKVLKGMCLPSFILHGSLEVQRAYLEEVIPEDGWVRIIKSKKGAEIGIGRAVVLYDPKKRSKNPLGRHHANLVEKYSEEKRIAGRRYWFMTPSRLSRLSKRKDELTARIAAEISDVIRSTPPTLLIDEKKLLNENGIAAREYFMGLNYSEVTGRVSAHWTIKAGRKLHVALFGLMAPPNDRKKRAKLFGWMKRNPDIVKKASLLLK